MSVTIIGIACGVYAATHRGRPSDRVIALMQFLFIAVPDFFWAIVAVLVFASLLRWLPATGYDPIETAGILGWLSHLLLPVLVLTCGLIAHVSRLTRSSMLDALQSRYVLAARAKGLPERLVLGGGRRAAAIAMLGVLAGGVYLGIDGYLSMNSFDPVLLDAVRVGAGSDCGVGFARRGSQLVDCVWGERGAGV